MMKNIKHTCLFVLMLAAIFTTACQSTGIDSPEAKARRAELRYQLGIDALYKGNLPKAFDELFEAERLAPKRPDILGAIGYAYQLRGDLKKANRYYLRAMRYNPSSSTYNNYGILLLLMDKPRQAEKYLRKALDNPRYNNQDIAFINLGDALLLQDRFNEAIEAYRRARAINPSQQLSRIKEAKAHMRYKRYAYARAMYITVLGEDPDNRQAIEGLLLVLRKTDEPTEARRQLARFIETTKNPKDKAWAEAKLAGLSR
jgi:type IV pilus biogenesis/stability protein PilW